MPAADAYKLQRFVDAQEPVIASVLAELRGGRKRGHWMWFIFPQLKRLGRSSTSQMFGISGLEEAVAYIEHPVLGPRLRECTQIVNAIEGRSSEEIFGEIDAMKFHSSMTLFAKAAPEESLFSKALAKYFASEFDSLTIGYLREAAI